MGNSTAVTDEDVQVLAKLLPPVPPAERSELRHRRRTDPKLRHLAVFAEGDDDELTTVDTH